MCTARPHAGERTAQERKEQNERLELPQRFEAVAHVVHNHQHPGHGIEPHEGHHHLFAAGHGFVHGDHIVAGQIFLRQIILPHNGAVIA